MTDRLYYTDPYLRAFDATIARVDRRDGRLVVTLDRTAFYPTSGGQPFDTGRLGPLRVVDVIDEDDGSIAHVVEEMTGRSDPVDEASAAVERRPGPVDPASPAGPKGLAGPGGPALLQAGDAVRGEIDWARRFDHMQQHTGQHVLSAAFDKLFGVRTVSFHLGGAVSTIDLAREMSPVEIAAAEAEANRIVWEDRPVAIRFADAEEAARLPLRKEAARGGTLRLIDVEGFDLSACGGTHVARTGGIGVIAVASWERFKGGQRLEFLCGSRALHGYRALRDAVTASVRLLSVLPAELPGAIERMQGEAKEQKRSMVALQDDLARYRAEELAAGADEVRLKPPFDAAQGGPEALEGPEATESKAVASGEPEAVASGFPPPLRTVAEEPRRGQAEAQGAEAGSRTSNAKLVLRALDADANVLKTLATAIAEKPGFLVALVSTSTPALVVIARSADVTVSAQRVLAALIAQFGGRGGGRPELAQGGGLAAPTVAILTAVRGLCVAE